MPTATEELPDARVNADPPTDVDAEKAFLGGLMNDGTRLAEVVVALGRQLMPEDFASVKNQLIFKAILARSTSSDNFEPLVLCDDLENRGELEKAGSRLYVSELVQYAVTGAALLDYARIISDKSKRRQLIKVSDRIGRIAQQPEGRSVAEIYDEAQGLIFALAEANERRDTGPQPMLNVINATLRGLQENAGRALRGVATGFTELDELTSGLEGGSLNIVAARPGVGKTSFAMNIVENIALNPEVTKPALVFSLEMPARQIAMRMLCSFGRVGQNDLEHDRTTPIQWSNILRKVRLLMTADNNSKLYIDDSSTLTPLDLRSRARRLAEAHGGLSVIMIDYIQLMRSQIRAENRNQEVGEISRSLKAVAKELNVPVIALSQLNREIEGRKDHRPMNSDLRESGSLEQDADLIIFIDRSGHRQEGGDGPSSTEEAKLIIGKNRHGGVKDIPLLFQGAYTSFYDFGQPLGEEEPAEESFAVGGRVQ